jgi:hypothetical protein
MKTIQNPELYENEKNNIFHQLRAHYLRLNIELHHEFEDKKIEKPIIEKQIIDKAPIQATILQSRMKKMQYMKVLRNGISIEDNDTDINLQLKNSNYYSYNNLLEKLRVNDIENDDEIEIKSWKQLTFDEQKIKIIEFAEKFKNIMDKEVWEQFKKDIIKKLKNKYFITNSVINWHKKSQSILEIDKLVINPACFYWEYD